ncbi:MAG: hypothetical protein GY711_27235 [bacterium]|nr:hypothetical protein [bacterium]
MQTSRHHRLPNGRRGSALATALLAVMVVSMLAASMLQVSGIVTRSLHRGTENTRAFYLAEAGLGEAYQALRVGRRGQIGSAGEPARYGQGLLWVDAAELADGRVRLESTALCGGGRAALSLTVEPVEVPLGFFSDEDIVIDDVLLVDGFNSEDGAYAEQVVAREVELNVSYPYLNIDEENGLLFQDGTFYRFQSVDGTTYSYDRSVTVAALADDPAYGPDDAYEIAADDFMDEDWSDDFEGIEYDGALAYFAANPDAGAGAGVGADPAQAVEVHTDGGGQIGSNGSISFTNAGGDPIAVYGDVTPGVGESVALGGDATVTGETAGRSSPVQLPEVDVPELDALGAIVQDEPIPLVIGSMSGAYTSIHVAADAELVVRGPCTFVVGTLTLEPGAEMSLDTTGGEISFFIEGGMDLAAGSRFTTTATETDEVAIQVGEIAPAGGVAPVNLEAQSEFYGTIYSPDTPVHVGRDFEVYGSLVGKSLDLAPGVRLHFDNADLDGSPLPRLLSWRIVEMPAVAKVSGDPFHAFGVAPDDLDFLADAHDLTGVFLAVSYLDHDGVVRSFSGAESDFDWMDVATVLGTERALDETLDDPGAVDPELPEEPEPARTTVEDAIANMASIALRDFLIAESPLNDAELVAVIGANPMSSAHAQQVVEAQSTLSDGVIETLIESDYLGAGGLKDVLIGFSPLSDEVLAVVEGSDVLTGAHKSEILAAQ